MFLVEWTFPNFHCFHHEWGLPPSYVKDNGGKTGGKVGGDVVEKSSDVVDDVVDNVVENITENIVENIIDVPSFVTRRRKGCKY